MSIFNMIKSCISGTEMKRLNKLTAVLIIAISVSMPSFISGKDYGKKKARKGDVHSFNVYLKMEKLKFHSSEDVVLHIVVRNITDEAATFYVFDMPSDSNAYKDNIYGEARGDVADFNIFRPVVYDMNGKNADIVVPYVTSGKKLKETLSWMERREINLGPGESFTHTQSLGKIYKLQADTDYRVKLHFFPFLNDPDEDQAIISSNELKFKVVRDKEYQPYKSADNNGIRLVPSEVVILLLNAEKEGYWDRAVKFINVEKFIHSYPEFSRRYDLADDSEKKNIEKEFIKYFISKRSDYLIEFKVVEEDIEPSGLVSRVSVIVSRNSLMRPERYKYVYTLSKNSLDDYIWMVSGIEATIIRDKKR